MGSVCVSQDKIDFVWPAVSRFIEAAYDGRGDDTPDVIFKDLKSGDAQLWLAFDGQAIHAAAVTKLIKCANGKKICIISCCGGENIDTWLNCIHDLEAFAKDEGCDNTRVMGRFGWKKLLEKRGYKQPWVCLQKELG